jgi:hypothetical protein
MANHKAEEYTKKQIEELVDAGDYRKVLMYGNIESRRIAYDVIHQKMNGGDWVTVHNHKERIKQLQEKVAELQQQRDAQVPDPNTYIAFNEISTQHGMRRVSSILNQMAAHADFQDRRMADLEAKNAALETKIDKTPPNYLHARIAQLEAELGAELHEKLRRVNDEELRPLWTLDEETLINLHVEIVQVMDERGLQAFIQQPPCHHDIPGRLEDAMTSQYHEPDDPYYDPADLPEILRNAEMRHQYAASQDPYAGELEIDLDPAAPHGGSGDSEAGGSDDTATVDLHDQDSSVDSVPEEPPASDNPEPVVEETDPKLIALNNALAEMGYPGHWEKKEGTPYTYIWNIDGYKREITPGYEDIIACLKDGYIKLDKSQHWNEKYQRLEEPVPEPNYEELYQQVQQENEQLKQQLAERENPAEIVSGSAELEQELAETKQLLKITTDAKDKVILRNRELEAENEILKTQLAELRAKLEAYEGMGA